MTGSYANQQGTQQPELNPKMAEFQVLERDMSETNGEPKRNTGGMFKKYRIAKVHIHRIQSPPFDVRGTENRCSMTVYKKMGLLLVIVIVGAIITTGILVHLNAGKQDDTGGTGGDWTSPKKTTITTNEAGSTGITGSTFPTRSMSTTRSTGTTGSTSTTGEGNVVSEDYSTSYMEKEIEKLRQEISDNEKTCSVRYRRMWFVDGVRTVSPTAT
ncbi:unnamed protein product [Darwinula stevensoni]|uniref:Uncharacterized protein n=1 Tax=Darwinula stevensoni TaxID=69355 RepID=A0A7R8XFC6_9CRUS|nr:unnamed protein product [Darwinula stevensoni]CAG0895378.1 unnamed protein product [Darwinula stevensoni]